MNAQRRVVELRAGRIHYQDVGTGPPLVFIHGLLVNGTIWRKVVPQLAGAFRCVVPDLPLGSHPQAMKPEADLSPKGIAAIIVEFLEALDLEGVTIVANDTGGALVQLLLVERPARIAQVVFTPSDGFERFPPALFRPLRYAARLPGGLTAYVQPLRIRLLRRLPIALGLLTKNPVPHPVTDGWMRPFFSDRGVRRDLRRFLRAMNPQQTLDAAKRLREFPQPVLMAWGSDDRVLPLAHGRRLAAAFPRAELREIADARTFVSEDQPEQLAQIIREFAGLVETAGVTGQGAGG